MPKISSLIAGSLILVSYLVVQAKSDQVKLSLGSPNDNKNDSSTFVATHEWQEIKAGQKVPSGLHYRMNLQTGKSEAKILEPEENPTKTSVQITENANEAEEVENSRNRLEEALKNIPADNFEEVNEERWKEVIKKHRSYEQIKKELKDVNLVPKTEAEILIKLMQDFKKAAIEEKIEILRDFAELLHAIDNSLLFISSGGIENILQPSLVNQTQPEIRILSLKIFGAMLQNNLQGKKFVSEETNLVSEILTIFAKTVERGKVDELSSVLYAVGSLLRNNNFISGDFQKKFVNIMMEILTRKEILFHLKAKTIILIDDMASEFELLTKEDKFCDNLAEFFIKNRNLLIIDSESTEKCASSLLNLENCYETWKENANFRHVLLVVKQNYKTRENEEENVKFLSELIVEHLENLNLVLYGELKIADDDLNAMYQQKDEL